MGPFWPPKNANFQSAANGSPESSFLVHSSPEKSRNSWRRRKSIELPTGRLYSPIPGPTGLIFSLRALKNYKKFCLIYRTILDNLCRISGDNYFPWWKYYENNSPKMLSIKCSPTLLALRCRSVVVRKRRRRTPPSLLRRPW